MRALVTTRHGGPSVLQLQDRPTPEPKAGEVRVRVRFAGLNFADVQARVGFYPDAPKPPTVLGYEVAGEIDAVGEGVGAAFTPGDRVFALTRFNGQAEQVCVPASQVHKLGPTVTLEQAAALPVNFLTAHHMLHQVGRLRAGEKVLIHQAAGGVGTAAIQLGKIAGFEMFGTASGSKHERLRALGLHHPIDYRNQDVRTEVEKLTGPRALQLVVDPIGPESWKQGYAMLQPGGQLIVFGFSTLVDGEKRNLWRAATQFLKVPKYSPLTLMGDNRSVGGVNVGADDVWKNPAVFSPQLLLLTRLLGEHQIQPLVDKVFPAAEGAAAHIYLQSRQSFGKVLLAF